MIFTWFKIFNVDDFLALDLVSKTYTLELEDIGLREIMVTHGETVAMTYEDVFLPLELLSSNPFIMDGFAAYVKENGDAYLGIAVSET